MAKRFDQLDDLAQTMGLDTRDPVAIRRRIDMLEKILERAFVIPGINRPVGVDAIVGLIPGIGDMVTTAMGAYIVWEARNLGLSKWQLTRMSGNVAFDTMIGLIPFVGDAADLFYRSNSRNLRLLRRHLDRNHPATATLDQVFPPRS